MDSRFLPKRGDVEGHLDHVVEECGESVAAIAKARRFGLDNYNPDLPPEDRETNRQWVLRELMDLTGAIERLADELGEQDEAL